MLSSRRSAGRMWGYALGGLPPEARFLNEQDARLVVRQVPLETCDVAGVCHAGTIVLLTLPQDDKPSLLLRKPEIHGSPRAITSRPAADGPSCAPCIAGTTRSVLQRVGEYHEARDGEDGRGAGIAERFERAHRMSASRRRSTNNANTATPRNKRDREPGVSNERVAASGQDREGTPRWFAPGGSPPRASGTSDARWRST